MAGKGSKRKDKSISGTTPPGKEQKTEATSEVIAKAHESLFDDSITDPKVAVSSNNVSNQAVSPSVPTPISVSTPMPLRPPSPISTRPPSPVGHIYIPPSPQPPILHQILNEIQSLNSNFANLNNKLDNISGRVEHLDTVVSGMKGEIDAIKVAQASQSEVVLKHETHHFQLEDNIQSLNNQLADARENFLELQTHTMKYNILIEGVRESNTETEDTEQVVHQFLKDSLKIEDAESIEFHNVHRLRKRSDGKPRRIIAKFVKKKDHERVLRVVPEQVKQLPGIAVYQQFPPEIHYRRSQLVPKMKELKRCGHNCKLVYDKLYINGVIYDPQRNYGSRVRNDAR